MSATGLLEIRAARLAKLRTLRERGIDPYPSTSKRTHLTAPLLADFNAHEGMQVTLAGRLMSWRPQGQVTFGHVADETGRLQLFLRADTVACPEAGQGFLAYPDLSLLDVGDFIEATGTLVRTRRGEPSLLVASLRLLTKSLRPLPEKWAGLRDRESILRRRYLRVVMSPEDKLPFEAIVNMVREIRRFLDSRGFMEFHTPVLQPQYGGGTARPFMTHVNALDCEMYLAISHELYLKRLIAAGFPKVYTLGRYFRNEGIDSTHQPEFSMLETMTAYENYEYGMALVEDLFRHVALTAFGRSAFRIRGQEVDLAQPWRRIAMVDAVREATGRDFRMLSVQEANAVLATLGVEEPVASIGAALVRAFELKVEPSLIQPTLVYGHPMEISPLAKPMASDPRFAERFEIFVGGIECGDNWSEQNDPLALLDLWRTTRAAVANRDEVHPLDYDFLEVLEHGMPPTTGIGPGVERMAMLLTEQENIDDVVFFPLMRPKVSEVNRAVYADEMDSKALSAVVESAVSVSEPDLCLDMGAFEELLTDGLLHFAGPVLHLTPRLRFWSSTTVRGQCRVTGEVGVEGLTPVKQLRVTGYRVASLDPPDVPAEVDRFEEHLRMEFQRLATRFLPGCEIVIAEATCGQNLSG